TVNGADQAEFWGSFRVGRRPAVEHTCKSSEEALEVRVRHDGFSWMEGKPIHQRSVQCSIDQLQVRDEVTARGIRHEVCARLLLHPDVEVVDHGQSLTMTVSGSALTLETEATIRLRRVEWFPRFGEARETTQVVLDYGSTPVSSGFRLRVIR
ncbi:MAG: heparinase II/III family protein, partial [Acidobacteriota bacterium]